jgi:DNA-binding transcriptional LysR family regulator
MDIELLKTFLEVKNTRHFGKAADNLYLTQAAVSARVKQLEDCLGVKLFIRSRNNIQLTSEGERLIPHAETMLVAWSKARQEVALKLEQKHQLGIGTTAGLWYFILQDKLSTIKHTKPELSLRAEAHNSAELLKMLTERVLDIAIVYEVPGLPELSTKAIGKLKLQLASPIKNLTTKTALQENYVYVDWGAAFGVFHSNRFNELPPAVLHTNMAAIAQSFIVEHGGSAFLPEKLIEDGSHSDCLYPVKDAPEFSRAIYVVYRSNSERIDLINEIIPLLAFQ